MALKLREQILNMEEAHRIRTAEADQKIKHLQDENIRLTKQEAQLVDENDQLRAKIYSLETFPDIPGFPTDFLGHLFLRYHKLRFLQNIKTKYLPRFEELSNVKANDFLGFGSYHSDKQKTYIKYSDKTEEHHFPEINWMNPAIILV